MRGVGSRCIPTRRASSTPRRHGGTHAGCKDPPFAFLGFTHGWVKSRKGKNVVRQTTAKTRFARALTALTDWCRANRHRPVLDQLARLSARAFLDKVEPTTLVQ
jgi:hypothetical protein